MRAGIRPRAARKARRWRRAVSALLLGAALAIVAALAAFAADGADKFRGPAAAQVVRVIDGDTFVARVRVWLGQDIETRVRVRGIDTPELMGRCEAESLAARAAQEFVVDLLPPGARVELSDIGPDKYAGRTLARVTLPAARETSRQSLDGGGDSPAAGRRDLAAVLIAAGHARPYAGGRRQGWCP